MEGLKLTLSDISIFIFSVLFKFKDATFYTMLLIKNFNNSKWVKKIDINFKIYLAQIYKLKSLYKFFCFIGWKYASSLSSYIETKRVAVP